MAKKRTGGDWLKALLLPLDSNIITLILLFSVLALLSVLGVMVSVPLAIVLGVLFVAKLLAIRLLVIPYLGMKVTGGEGMIGRQGRVVQPLTPDGMIIVQGERWKAESVDGSDIKVDGSVEVVGQERLTLKVVRLREN
jgi:membrane-bound ClpP family serine protease